ncbi:MAG: DMT family transporter [Thermotogae bacterium]|nr:DMT family transporter [Thermotogota bacterium]
MGVVSVSLSSLFIRLVGTAPLKIAFYRTLIASSVYLLVNIIKDKKIFTKVNHNSEIIFSGFLLALHFALWISAFEHTTVAGVVIPLLIQPIIIGLFSWLFFKESISKKSFISLAVISFGILLMNLWDFRITSSIGFGDLLSTVGTIVLCFYFLFAKKLGKKIGTLRFNFYTYSIASMFLLAFSLIKKLPIKVMMILSLKELFFYILLAVICSFLGYTFINLSFKHLKAISVSVGLLGEPLLGMLWAGIFLGEKLTVPQFFGLVITTTGILIYFKSKSKIM